MEKIFEKYRKIQNFILEYRKIQNELGIQKNTENTEKYRHTLRPAIVAKFIYKLLNCIEEVLKLIKS